MRKFSYKIEDALLQAEILGASKMDDVQSFQSQAYEALTEDRKHNVYFCPDQYRAKLFNRGGEAVRLFNNSEKCLAAQAMLTPCADIFDFIEVTGSTANMIEIQNYPGNFAAISNFLINPKTSAKRGLAKCLIEKCYQAKPEVDFLGFICVSTNRAILKEALAAGCKIFSVTMDKRLNMQTYLLGISRIHAPVGGVTKIDFRDEIVLANFFDMGYAVEEIDWVSKTLKLRMQTVIHQTAEQTA